MEHRITITLAELGWSAEDIEAVLDGFLATHPEAGPVVSANTESGELSVTWSLEADSLEDAHDRSTPVFVEGMEASGVREAPPVRIEIELVEVEEPVEGEASPELQPA